MQTWESFCLSAYVNNIMKLVFTINFSKTRGRSGLDLFDLSIFPECRGLLSATAFFDISLCTSLHQQQPLYTTATDWSLYCSPED